MSWTRHNTPRKGGELFGELYFSTPLYRTRVEYTSPRAVKLRDIEFMRFCGTCRRRYSPFCKHCVLDAACSFHGVDFEDGQCPICGNTFQEDWDRYIIYKDRFERGLI